MVKVLLVDDGKHNRLHRENMLSKDFTHTGVACNCHPLFGEVCCILYGKGIEEKPKVERVNSLPIKEKD